MSLVHSAELNAEELRKVRSSEQNQRTVNARLTAKLEELQRILQLRDLEIAKLLHRNEVHNFYEAIN